MSSHELPWRAAASANLLGARERNGRLGKSKSRYGCLTCKRRRVKCDETQPECNRCQSSGRRCGGYTESPPSSKSRSPSSSIGSPVGNTVIPDLSLQDHEKRQLDFFVSNAAPCLAGSFDRDFWCGSVLQVAQHEPVIMDCLLAISTLYEHPQYLMSFNQRSKPQQSIWDLVTRSRDPVYGNHALPPDTNHIQALMFYNRAIRGLKQRLKDGNASSTLALVSCILFVCVETIRDQIQQAMLLYARGIDMLNHFAKSTTSTSELALLGRVRNMFVRLGVLAATFGQPVSALLKLDHTQPDLGSHFRDLAQARLELFAVLAESNAFTLASNKWREALFDAKQWQKDGSHHARLVERKHEIESLFEDLKERCIKHLWKLQRWRQAFEPLRERSQSTEPGPISYLLMIYQTFMIWIPTRLSHRKVAFDAHKHEFTALLDYAEVLLNHNRSERPIFTFEMGAIPPLYYVASECRVPSIRRKALALLKRAPRKESVLGADTSAELAYRLISIEERGLGLPDAAIIDQHSDAVDIDDSVMPAEDKRVHFMEIVKDGAEWAIRVTMLVEVDDFFHWQVEDVPI